jgi:hypothetical protein
MPKGKPIVPALPLGRPQFRGEPGALSDDGFTEIESDVMPYQRLPRYRARCSKSEPPEVLEGSPMKLSEIGMRRLLQVSSALIIVGLLLEIASLLWFHPLSFVLWMNHREIAAIREVA